MIVRGVDTDNYDGDIAVDRFSSLGLYHSVAFNIIGLEAMMPYARVQYDNSIASGLTVPCGYKFPYWKDDDLERMKGAAGFGIPVAIDCEWQTGMPGGVEATVERIHQCKDLLVSEGLYWGIYTGEWWWVPYTGNCEDFKDDNWWHAAYPYGNKLPPEDYLPDFTINYGGKTQATIRQYADCCYDEPGFDMNAMSVPDVAHDTTLDIMPGLDGMVTHGPYQIFYNAGVPIWRYGGTTPGATAKNRGGVWVFLRDNGAGQTYWSLQEGD